MTSKTELFSSLSRKAAQITGSWQAFIAAASIVIAWLIGGFFIGFGNELYQLFINTFTTIITFIMVFLIQSAQNRDTRALQIKLDEIICVLEKADDKLINIEDATDEEIDHARDHVAANDSNPDAKDR